MFAFSEKLLAFAINRVVPFAMLVASNEYYMFMFCMFVKVAGVRTKPRCAICYVAGVQGILHFAC